MLKPKGFLLTLILIFSFFTFLQAFIVHYVPPVEAYDWTSGGVQIAETNDPLQTYQRIGFYDEVERLHRVFYLGTSGHLRDAYSSDGLSWTTEIAIMNIPDYRNFGLHWDGSIVHITYCQDWTDALHYIQGTPKATGWTWGTERTVHSSYEVSNKWRYIDPRVTVTTDDGYPYVVANLDYDRGAGGGAGVSHDMQLQAYKGNNVLGTSFTLEDTLDSFANQPWARVFRSDVIALDDGRLLVAYKEGQQPDGGATSQDFHYNLYDGTDWEPPAPFLHSFTFDWGGLINTEDNDMAFCARAENATEANGVHFVTQQNRSGGWDTQFDYAIDVDAEVLPSPYYSPTIGRNAADDWQMVWGNATGIWRTTYNKTSDTWATADQPFGASFTELSNRTSIYRNATTEYSGLGVLWCESTDSTPYNLMFGAVEQEFSDTEYEVTTQIQINGYTPYTNVTFSIDGTDYANGQTATLGSSEYGALHELDGTPVTHLTFLNWTITAGSLSVTNDADPTTDLSVLSDGTLTLHLNATVDITHSRTGITNMDCKNWTITEYKYYAFESEYICTNSYLDTAEWSFLDMANHNVTAYFTNSTSEGVYDYSLDYADTGNNGTYSYVWQNLTDQTLNVTVYLWLKYPLIDLMYVDLYIQANCTGYGMTNSTGGWEVAQANYFNLYSKGGLEEMFTGFSDPSEPLGGVAGRDVGGDFFNLYAYNNSYAESYQYWRGLVHFKAMFEFQWDHGSYSGYPWEPPSQDWPDDNNIEIGWAYYARGEWCENKDAFIRLRLESFGWQSNHQFSRWAIHFVVSGSTIYTDYILGWFDPGSDSYKIWIDLWFNEANASSLMGERASSYWFAMEDNSIWPWNAFTGNDWGVLRENQSAYLCFEILEAEGSEQALSSTEIEMVRLRCKMEQFVSTYNYTFHIWKIPEMDMTFDSGMNGISTPNFQPTQIPSMPMGGFLGVLYTAIMWLGEQLGTGIMQSWYVLVGFLDGTIGAWLGQPQFFSWFFAQIGNLWDYMVNSFTYALSLLLSFFAFLAVTMTKFASVVSLGFNTWASMFTMGITILDNGLDSGINFWNDLGMYQWLTLSLILYPIWLIDLWDKEGLQAVIDHIMFLVNIFSFLVNLMIRIAQFGVTVITQIIEIVPVVE